MNKDGNGAGPLASTASSAGVWKSADRIPDQFPAGLRVLVVDDDLTCLKFLEKLLTTCKYEVTTCSKAVVALSMLREKKDGFDLVLSDVYMPDMDGFKLLEHIGLEMDLPVIMMSSDDKKEVVMKGVTHGACDYLIKPIRIEAVKNIWQHVVRKRRNEYRDFEHSGSLEDSDKLKKSSEDGDFASSINEGSWRNSKRRKDIKEEEDEGEEREDSSALKKPRVVWSVELHQQFVSAVNQLGIDKAVPKKILELMNVPGLTRENVASHLQKYRLYLRRLSGVSQNQGGLSNSFVAPSDVNFNSITSFDGLDLQALAVSGHLPQQNFVTLQSDMGRAAVATSIGVSLAEQMNLFNPSQAMVNSPKLKFGTPQVDNKQRNLPQGLPISFEQKQLPQLHHAVPNPFGSVDLQVTEGLDGFLNLPMQVVSKSSHVDPTHVSRSSLMQMTQQSKQLPVVQNMNQILSNMSGQPRLRGQFPNETTGGHVSDFSPSMGDQILSYNAVDGIPGKNSPILNGRSMSSGSSYITISQAASVDFPVTHATELPGNDFLITSRGGLFPTAVTASLGSVEALRKGAHLKDTKPLINYDVYNGQSIAFNATQNTILPVNPDFEVGHHGLGGVQKNGYSRNEYGSQGICQSQGNMSVETSFIVKTEGSAHLCHETLPLSEHVVDDDPLNAFFKQHQQEGAGTIDPEFNFDGFPMDNIPV